VRTILRLLGGAAIVLSAMPYIRFGGIFLTASDVCVLVCLALILAITPRLMSIRMPWLNCGVVLLLLGFLLSAYSSPEWQRTVILIAQYAFALWLMPIMLFTLVGMRILDPPAITDLFVKAMVFVQLIGVGLYFVAPDLLPEFMIGGRMGSLFENPNILAKMTALTLPLILYLNTIGRGSLVISVIRLGVSAAALAVSASLAGIGTAVGGVLVFVVVLWLQRTGRRRLKGPVIVLLFTAFISALTVSSGIVQLPAVFSERVLVNAIDQSEYGTLDMKLELASEALDFIGESPVIGIGADQYANGSRFGTPVHNLYLLVWAEGGILSLVGLVLILLAPLSLVRGRASMGDAASSSVVLAVLAVFVVSAMTNTHVYARYWFMPLWIAVMTGDLTSGTKGVLRPPHVATHTPPSSGVWTSGLAPEQVSYEGKGMA